MGLDATVFCDCVEKGRLQVPHPFPERLSIDEDGRPEIDVDDLTDAYSAEEQAHDSWFYNSPCEHTRLVLVHHYLGNIGLVSVLRGAVSILFHHEDDFPVLRQRVIYSGIHSGDHLNLEQVMLLSDELKDLEGRDWSGLKWRDAGFLRAFIVQMKELIAASLSVEKPIAF